MVPAGSHLALRRIPEGAFAFTAELTVAKPVGTESGHCGVILDGIHFMITPSTAKPVAIANTAYRVAGEARSRGASGGLIPGFEHDKPIRVMVSRAKLGEGHKYSYTVNGRPVDSFIVAMPADGKIRFYGYRNSITVDQFQLYALKGDASNNLVVNSSFEYLQEGMPNYMKPLMSGKVRFEGKWEDCLKAFAIDTGEKVSGNQSARVTLAEAFAPGKGSPQVSRGVGTHNVSVMAKTPVTFSAYLKAADDDFPVTMNLWELWHKNHSKAITISKRWQRYSFTMEGHQRGDRPGEYHLPQGGDRLGRRPPDRDWPRGDPLPAQPAGQGQVRPADKRRGERDGGPNRGHGVAGPGRGGEPRESAGGLYALQLLHE